MTGLSRKISLAATVLAFVTLAGCATRQLPNPVPELPAPAPPATEEYNIFPDPLTGRVEIYRNGEDVGSVTGEETEDPPVPRLRPGDDPERE